MPDPKIKRVSLKHIDDLVKLIRRLHLIASRIEDRDGEIAERLHAFGNQLSPTISAINRTGDLRRHCLERGERAS